MSDIADAAVEPFHHRNFKTEGHLLHGRVAGAVWFSGDDLWVVEFGQRSAIKVDVWMDRAGVEALRDACNVALVRTS